MYIYSIDAGRLKLDGGAMFGVVPKSLWSKHNPADENNLCSWAMRCMLVEDGKQLILIDTGMGNKQDARWQGFYHHHGEGDLVSSINKAGFSVNDVTDVILSHLHFDHAGGAVSWNTSRTRFELTFPNATYWSASEHWALATQPNAREKASFLKENILPIKESGHLRFLDTTENPFENLSFRYTHGHTEQMILPIIDCKGQKVIFMADTTPSVAHLGLSWGMGYDTQPLRTIEDKQSILGEAAANDYFLFFDHDPLYECCTVELTEKGFKPKELGDLKDFLG